MADVFVFAPKFMFAELRTITCVIGKPPINPEITFPNPCAFNSRLVGVILLSGSNLSVASTQSKVSKLPTTAMTIATVQTAGLNTDEKSGKVNCSKKSATELGTGNETNCFAFKEKFKTAFARCSTINNNSSKQ